MIFDSRRCDRKWGWLYKYIHENTICHNRELDAKNEGVWNSSSYRMHCVSSSYSQQTSSLKSKPKSDFLILALWPDIEQQKRIGNIVKTDNASKLENFEFQAIDASSSVPPYKYPSETAFFKNVATRFLIFRIKNSIGLVVLFHFHFWPTWLHVCVWEKIVPQNLLFP